MYILKRTMNVQTIPLISKLILVSLIASACNGTSGGGGGGSSAGSADVTDSALRASRTTSTASTTTTTTTTTSTTTSTTSSVQSFSVYYDAMASGWQKDGGWGFTVNTTNISPVKSGAFSMLVKHTTSWSGFALDSRTSSWSINDIPGDKYSYLSFYVNPGATTLSKFNALQISIESYTTGAVGVPKLVKNYATPALAANSWSLVRIPLSDLNPNKLSFFRILFFNNSSNSAVNYSLDDVKFELATTTTPPPTTTTPPPTTTTPPPTTTTPPPTTTTPPPTTTAGTVNFAIDTTKNRQPISPYIYGINSPDFARLPGLPMTRLGGNRWTAYNWENNASNAGTDWNNQSDGYLSTSNIPGQAIKSKVTTAHSYGAAVLVTIPMLDYVAADKLGTSVTTVASDTNTRWKKNLVTNPSGNTLTPSTTDNYVYQSDLVNFVEKTFPYARTDAKKTIFYSLDNEPGLWPGTHPLLHPTATTYAEMATRTINTSQMVKAIAPSALVFGAVTYGFNEQVNLQNAPDANGRDYLNFFLSTLKQAETTYGKRLVDVLDIHWYPEAKSTSGVRVSDENTTNPSEDIIVTRLQLPRTLWDSTYRESSWIDSYLGGPINLIPSLKSKINTYYPNTKLSISEYNFGGGSHISGGLAQTDVLGAFGREGLFAATYWALNGGQDYINGAFDMFLNYDGANGKVGDISVAVTNPDTSNTSVYAMASSTNSNVVYVVAINKSSSALTANFSLTHPTTLTNASVYVLSSSLTKPQAGNALTSSNVNQFQYNMPARSATTLVFTANATTSTTTGTTTTTPTTTTTTTPSTTTGTTTPSTTTTTTTPTPTTTTTTPSTTQVVTDFANAIAAAQCPDPECMTMALKYTDNVTPITGITYRPNHDSVVVKIPAIVGAKDYRVYTLPIGSNVSVDANKFVSVTGTTIYCAGIRQRNIPKMTNPEVLREIEVSNITSNTKIVIEALDTQCPFSGVEGTVHKDIQVTINEVPLADRVKFSFFTEAEIRAKYGSLIINGHAPSTVLAQPAPNILPKALGRAIIEVTPMATATQNMQFYDDFADNDTPAFVNYVNNYGRGTSSLPYNPIGSGMLHQNKNWNFYSFGFEESQIMVKRGQLIVNLADWFQDIMSSIFFHPKKPVQISSSSYLHTSFEVAENASARRYWWFGVCGSDTPNNTYNTNGTLKAPLVQTAFFYQQDGRNPSPLGWNCFQLFPRDGYIYNLGTDNKKPETDVSVIINKTITAADPNNNRTSVVNVGPQQYYVPGDETRWTLEANDPLLPAGSVKYGKQGWYPGRTWFKQRASDGTPTVGILDDVMTLGQKVKYDIFLSRNRVVMYVNGQQRLCNDFGPHQLTMAEGALGLGQVLYHSAAERLEFSRSYNDHTAQRYYLENTPYSDTRNWDNIGYSENVTLPSSFDETKCFVYGEDYR